MDLGDPKQAKDQTLALELSKFDEVDNASHWLQVANYSAFGGGLPLRYWLEIWRIMRVCSKSNGLGINSSKFRGGGGGCELGPIGINESMDPKVSRCILDNFAYVVPQATTHPCIYTHLGPFKTKWLLILALMDYLRIKLHASKLQLRVKHIVNL